MSSKAIVTIFWNKKSLQLSFLKVLDPSKNTKTFFWTKKRFQVFYSLRINGHGWFLEKFILKNYDGDTWFLMKNSS